MGFDRIKTPEQRLLERDQQPDPEGRNALFTGGGERPTTPGMLPSMWDGVGELVVHCARCGQTSALDARAIMRAVLPIVLVAPWRDHPVFAVCPAGGHRAWLKVSRQA